MDSFSNSTHQPWNFWASLQEAKQAKPEFVDGLGTWVVNHLATWHHPHHPHHPHHHSDGWKSMGILWNPPNMISIQVGKSTFWFTTVWQWKFSGKYISVRWWTSMAVEIEELPSCSWISWFDPISTWTSIHQHESQAKYAVKAWEVQFHMTPGSPRSRAGAKADRTAMSWCLAQF